MEPVCPGVLLFRDTCNVYVLHAPDGIVLVDFGSGAVLDALPQNEISHVLHTHYHRDQCQGDHRLPRQTRILVPEIERQFFEDVETFWLYRQLWNNYDNTDDRYCRFRAVPVSGLLRDEEMIECAGQAVRVLPAPGHTTGSVALLMDLKGVRVAFVGDLLYAGGRLWSLAATQWSYNGQEGIEGTLWSLRRLREESPDIICPSHGPVINNPAACLDQLEERLWRLLTVRGSQATVRTWLDATMVEISPNLYWSQVSQAHTYVVLSGNGKALVIDPGYQGTVFGPSNRLHHRRPMDRVTPWLRENKGIGRIDVALFTHVHDDHIASAPLLRRRHGMQIWASAAYADILRRPAHYDLPCLWYEPILPDRVIPDGEPFDWEGIPFVMRPLPGHVLYAVSIEFEIDGKRVLATGDQQANDALLWNYVYRNRFRHFDYRESATQYQTVRPDLIISGHWPPMDVTDAYLDGLLRSGQCLHDLHAALLPLDEYDAGAEGRVAFLRPYQTELTSGRAVFYAAEIRNPYPRSCRCAARLVFPQGWHVEPSQRVANLEPAETVEVAFIVTPHELHPRFRALLGLEVSFDDGPWDCLAEAVAYVDRPIAI